MPQGYAGDHPADDAEEQGQARGQGKLARCEPVVASFSIETKATATEAPISRRPALAHHRSAGAGKQHAADAAPPRTRGQQPARPPAIGEIPVGICINT
jgi:hypothetical protein